MNLSEYIFSMIFFCLFLESKSKNNNHYAFILEFSFQSANRKKLEKHYEELVSITHLPQTSARIRFMIQDVMDFRKVRNIDFQKYDILID